MKLAQAVIGCFLALRVPAPLLAIELPLIPSWSAEDIVDSLAAREGDLVDLWIMSTFPAATGFLYASAEVVSCLDVVTFETALAPPALTSWGPLGECRSGAAISHSNCPIVVGLSPVMHLVVRAPQLEEGVAEDSFGFVVMSSMVSISEDSQGCGPLWYLYGSLYQAYAVLHVRSVVPAGGITWGGAKAMYR